MFDTHSIDLNSLKKMTSNRGLSPFEEEEKKWWISLCDCATNAKGMADEELCANEIASINVLRLTPSTPTGPPNVLDVCVSKYVSDTRCGWVHLRKCQFMRNYVAVSSSRHQTRHINWNNWLRLRNDGQCTSNDTAHMALQTTGSLDVTIFRTHFFPVAAPSSAINFLAITHWRVYHAVIPS